MSILDNEGHDPNGLGNRPQPDPAPKGGEITDAMVDAACERLERLAPDFTAYPENWERKQYRRNVARSILAAALSLPNPKPGTEQVGELIKKLRERRRHDWMAVDEMSIALMNQAADMLATLTAGKAATGEGDGTMPASASGTNTTGDQGGACAALIARLVNRFLAWPLPKSVCSDLCVTDRDYKFPRSGTSLLTAEEARQMIEYLLAGEASAGKAAGPGEEEIANIIMEHGYVAPNGHWYLRVHPITIARAVLALLHRPAQP